MGIRSSKSAIAPVNHIDYIITGGFDQDFFKGCNHSLRYPKRILGKSASERVEMYAFLAPKLALLSGAKRASSSRGSGEAGLGVTHKYYIVREN